MSHLPRTVLTISLLLSVVQAAHADEPAQKKPEGDKAAQKAEKFVRIQRDEEQTVKALETAIVSYVSADASKPALTVDLIGAIHVADKSYYDELNRTFESYDTVLYELVAPEGTRIPKGGREGSGSPVSSLQVGLKRMLDLEFQLDRIDYTKTNLVHADMSPEEFAKTMKDRGESFTQMLFRMIGQSMAMQSRDSARGTDVGMLFALFSKNRPLQLKRVVAEQFEDIDVAMGAFDGPQGSTIITERNKRALAVLDKEIKAGKRKLAIFYGAGHLPDLERRLLADYGLKRQNERWLSAWSMVDKADSQ